MILTISSETRKAGPYTGNGVTTSFSFAFKVFTTADVLVVLTNLSALETVLTLSTDYTVTLNSNQDSNPGGTVVLPSALITGFLLTLSSQVGALQATDLTNQGGFYPSVLNTALDKLTILVQQLKEQVGRAVKVDISSSITPATLTTYIVALYNNLANIITVSGNTTNINTVAGNTTNINTVAANNTNVTNVGGSISNVNAVAGNATNINAVAGNATNINTVASNNANVTSVGSNIADVVAVNSNATNINAVNANATNINTNATNITAIQNASSNATAAAASATTASTQATNSANSATASAASAAAALVSQNAAATSQANSATSETNAGNSAAAAAGSATSASASAVTAVNAPGTSGTSTSSMTIGVATQSFTTQTGKAWVQGQFVTLSSSTPASWMYGYISSYNSSTGAMVVVATTISGSGTFAAWTIGLAAPLSANVVTQSDVGTAPNQVPLNQYLGGMAYQDPNSVSIGGGSISNPQVLNNQFVAQSTPTAISTAGSTTLTIAQLLTRIITVTQTAAVTLVLPTGTLADAGILSGQLLVGQAFDWNVINLGNTSGAITVQGGTNNTYVGFATVAINTSATFRTLKTATNTYITYRVN